jgi:uroporphyrinogen decarboxylase
MDAVLRMMAALEHQAQNYIPRGELWLGREVFNKFQSSGEKFLQSHIQLCRESGMDFISLPVKMPASEQLNYNRFCLDEIQEAAAQSDLFTCVVIDGPFQQLVNKMGLEAALLTSLTQNSGAKGIKETARVTQDLIRESIERGVNAVVIADDIAFRRSTYANPQILRDNLFVLYKSMIDPVHKQNCFAMFHSDGNITSIIDDLINCGFDGLAGCEPECLDLISLKKTFGSKITFMTGIQAGLLYDDRLTLTRKHNFIKKINALGKNGGFVLCSATGVSSTKALERLKDLYLWADEAL